MSKKIKKIINKKNKSKIICLTAYSKNVAEAIDPYTDIILIGDSLGTTLYNYTTTRSVTLHTMIEHSKSARQGIKNSLMVVDMPYKTYNNKSEALRNAKKIIKQTKCDAVKLEGGSSISKAIILSTLFINFCVKEAKPGPTSKTKSFLFTSDACIISSKTSLEIKKF